MSLTFAQLRQAVVDNTGRSDKTSVINTAIQMALNNISNFWRFREQSGQATVVTSTDDLSATLPSGADIVRDAIVIFGTSSYPIDLRNKQWFRARWPNVSASGSGKPYIGYVDQGLLYFAPKCNQSYDILVDYYTRITLVADSDTIVVPTLDGAVIAYASAWVFKSIEQLDSATAWERVYAGELSLAKDHDQSEPGINYIADQVGTAGVLWTDPQLDPFAKDN